MRGASGVCMITQNKKNSNVSNLKCNRTIADDFIHKNNKVHSLILMR